MLIKPFVINLYYKMLFKNNSLDKESKNENESDDEFNE
jgi:hypothetical protein